MTRFHFETRLSRVKITGALTLAAASILITQSSLQVSSYSPQQSSVYTEARWMRKLRTRQALAVPGGTLSSISVGSNVNVSNEPGPQSEVFIAVDTQHPSVLAAGSNEIFRDPQRTYFSSDGGASWLGADLPLVDEEGTTWSFASDPGVAVDTRGTIFFSQLLIASVDNNFKGD